MTPTELLQGTSSDLFTHSERNDLPHQKRTDQEASVW